MKYDLNQIFLVFIVAYLVTNHWLSSNGLLCIGLHSPYQKLDVGFDRDHIQKVYCFNVISRSTAESCLHSDLFVGKSLLLPIIIIIIKSSDQVWQTVKVQFPEFPNFLKYNLKAFSGSSNKSGWAALDKN